MTTRIAGRAPELAQLARARGSALTGPHAVLITGEAGVGKTTLLRRAVADAAAAGFRTVTASPPAQAVTPPGATAAKGHAPAGRSAAHAVLAGLLAAGTLPMALRRPLEEWLAGAPTSAVSLRLATLAVVLHLCRTAPLAVAIDNVREEDAEAVLLLQFVVRRLRRERFLLLYAASSLEAFGAVAAEVTVLAVPPLPESAAAGLLDAYPSAPTGRIRASILQHAGGNPFAILELARRAAGTGPTEPLPALRFRPSGPLARTFAPGLTALPEATRRVLLHAAAAGADPLGNVLTAAGAGLADCGPAELAGLIQVVGGRLTFRHPMVRAACYFTAAPRERQEAHSRLAALLPADSGQRDWHLANSAEATGDLMALAFERAADEAVRARRGLEAAGLLQQAAECSTDPRAAARRYGRAAQEALRCGDVVWSAALWQRVIETTDDDVTVGTAAIGLGNVMMFQPAPHTFALAERLLRAAVPPELAIALGNVAARVVIADGDPADLPRLRRIHARVVELAGPAEVHHEAEPADEAPAQLAMLHAIADPGSWAGQWGPLAASPILRTLAGDAERSRLMSVGGVALALDETGIALDHYRRALHHARADGSLGLTLIIAVALAEVLFDLGLFEEAEAVLTEADDAARADSVMGIRRRLLAQHAALAVRRGRLDRARQHLDALGPPRPEDDSMVRMLAHRAAGRYAAATGDPAGGYERLRLIFAPDGTPLHYLWCSWTVVEVAAAAVAAGRQAEASRLLRAAREKLSWLSPRRRWSWDAALAILEPGDDGACLAELLAAPGSAADGPYDVATVEVHHADRLRQRRRVAEARPWLLSALDTYLKIGATAEADSVRAKVRTTGIRAAGTGNAAFDELTAQHQQIARLAARGLSNKAIADRFGLSPRTIGFHLYQIYPKLGIARREQLRAAVPWEER
ncbi:helix-turn-helix transcriptional regulator [Actinoplanes sp. RD1]|uniref:helix-turn-helix transcriptional regulator n=1 Tax=Actinoplanes sp. RD1 TaxID=3064538 RepID=UPI00274059CC|nr:LuxR C-terminal-related transcriptional regulator [Actinoplanes sp. RD1]